MYGVPESLDLRPFQGDYLTQICLGMNELQFVFGAGGHICVEGHWELRGPDGSVLDQAVDPRGDRESYRVHRILMATVTATKVDPPRSFTLVFDNGLSLTVFDSSEHYESCSIQPGGVII